MNYLHLATGSAVLPRADDDGFLLVAPDERFAELRSADHDGLGALLAGVGPAADDVHRALADQVVGWGAGRLADQARPPRERARLTHLLGGVRDRVADRLRACLVAGEVLDDRRLLAVDGEDAGPWLPVHRELGQLVVGPLLAGPPLRSGALAWADVRFRRLAASPGRPQLLELWAAWQRHGDLHDVRPKRSELDDAVRRLETWLEEQGSALERHQLLVPLDGSPLTTHPVLPVPAGLLGLSA